MRRLCFLTLGGLGWTLCACAAGADVAAADIDGPGGAATTSGTSDKNGTTGGSQGAAGTTSGTTTSPASSNGRMGTATTSGNEQSAGAGATGGAASGGSTSGAGSAGAGTSGNGGINGTQLEGSLAFDVAFVGELYGLLPDGGADLDNLDCRIGDGTDLMQQCAASQDAGVNTLQSKHIVDIYVTNPQDNLQPDAPEVQGTALVGGDGGAFATIELTWLIQGTHVVATAQSGSVDYLATATEMSGSFEALFTFDGGTETLSGTFGAPYCAALNGY